MGNPGGRGHDREHLVVILVIILVILLLFLAHSSRVPDMRVSLV